MPMNFSGPRLLMNRPTPRTASRFFRASSVRPRKAFATPSRLLTMMVCCRKKNWLGFKCSRASEARRTTSS